jgi:hypothetical protein
MPLLKEEILKIKEEWTRFIERQFVLDFQPYEKRYMNEFIDPIIVKIEREIPPPQIVYSEMKKEKSPSRFQHKIFLRLLKFHIEGE